MCCPAHPKCHCSFMLLPLLSYPVRAAFSSVGADEIDAIGKARGGGGGDAGTRERESGLLQLLYEMDGFNQNDRVLARPKPEPALALLSLKITNNNRSSCGL